MRDTNEYTNITKEEFLAEYQKMRYSLTGYGRRIAEIANVDYIQLKNAKTGRVRNPIILDAILTACKIVYKEIKDQYTIKCN